MHRPEGVVTMESQQEAFQLAVQRLAQGKRNTDVIGELASAGVPEDAARFIVDRAQEIKKRVYRKEGMKTVGIGLGIIAVGAVITALSYEYSSGGHYLVTSGAFVVGGWVTLKGLWRTALG